MMLPGDSEAFAVSDHQIAHIYVKDISRIDLVAKLCNPYQELHE